MAAKRRKMHKNKISGLIVTVCYNEQNSKFRLFTNPLLIPIISFFHYSITPILHYS